MLSRTLPIAYRTKPSTQSAHLAPQAQRPRPYHPPTYLPACLHPPARPPDKNSTARHISILSRHLPMRRPCVTRLSPSTSLCVCDQILPLPATCPLPLSSLPRSPACVLGVGCIYVCVGVCLSSGVPRPRIRHSAVSLSWDCATAGHGACCRWAHRASEGRA
jgi:hypothetical protein